MNVALTRAKHLLVVFGKYETLVHDAKWEKMLNQVDLLNSKVDLFDEQLIQDE